MLEENMLWCDVFDPINEEYRTEPTFLGAILIGFCALGVGYVLLVLWFTAFPPVR
jgi:hypothetical protein